MKWILPTVLSASLLLTGCAKPRNLEWPLAPLSFPPGSSGPLVMRSALTWPRVQKEVFDCISRWAEIVPKNVVLSNEYSKKLRAVYKLPDTLMINPQCIEVKNNQLSPDAKKVVDIYNAVFSHVHEAMTLRIGTRQNVNDGDLVIWGQQEYWATGLQTAAKQDGDCEDIALATYELLLTAGLHPQQIFLWYIPENRQLWTPPHMVLLVYPQPITTSNFTSLRGAQKKPLILNWLEYWAATWVEFTGVGISLNPMREGSSEYQPMLQLRIDEPNDILNLNPTLRFNSDQYSDYFRRLLGGKK